MTRAATRITVVRVNMTDQPARDAMQALIFPILAALTPETFELHFFDDRLESLPDDIPTGLIAFSVETYAAKRAYLLARRYKTQDNWIVMGGFHPTAVPEEAQRFADTVLVGDAEDTWPRLLADYLAGTPQPLYRSSFAAPLQPIDHRHPSIKGRRYLPLAVAQLSRGCVHHCDFCSVHSFYGRTLRRKPAAVIAAELATIDQKLLFVADDNLLADPADLSQFCQIIKPLRKQWICQISIAIARQDDLLSEMKQAGCVMVLIGFESLNVRNLDQMSKTANLQLGDYERAIANIYAHGLLIYGTFIIGYDEDTAETAAELLAFAMRHHFAVANFNPLMPMPGTACHRRLEEAGRLLERDWWLSDTLTYGEPVFEPAKLSRQELAATCLAARTGFYSRRAIWQRWLRNKLWRRPRLGLALLLANMISGREIRRKQGQLPAGPAGRDLR